jgi:hypothetical protein
VFDRIWNTREHKCEVCDTPIVRKNKSVGMFSHVLSKGSYPELRLDEENILLKGDGLYDNCDCHHEWEHRTADMRNIERWRPVFLLQDALKRKANVENKPNYNFKENEIEIEEIIDEEEIISEDEVIFEEDESQMEEDDESDFFDEERSI